MPEDLSTPRTAPIEITGHTASWRDAFSVLAVPNFRRFVITYAALISAISMQRVILAWTMLEVTGDVSQVGLTVTLQYAPMLFFGLFAGAIADRWPKQRILLVCQLAYIALAVATTLLAAFDGLDLITINLVGFLIGVVQAFQHPAANGMAGEIVATQRIPAAVSFTSSAFQAGQVVGPAIGGALLAHLGSVFSWGATAAVLAVSLVLLLRIDRAEMRLVARPPGTRATVASGFSYLGRKPEFLLTLVLVLVVSACVYATPVFLTSFADDEFHIGAAGFGMLNAVLAFGAVGGAVLSARRPAPTLRRILFFAALLGVSQIIVSGITGLVLFCVFLALRGAASLLATTAANSFFQLNSNPLMRGRMLAFYGVVMNAGMALGNLVMGGVIASFGVRPALFFAGLIPALLALVLWGWTIQFERRRARA